MDLVKLHAILSLTTSCNIREMVKVGCCCLTCCPVCRERSELVTLTPLQPNSTWIERRAEGIRISNECLTSERAVQFCALSETTEKSRIQKIVAVNIKKNGHITFLHWAASLFSSIFSNILCIQPLCTPIFPVNAINIFWSPQLLTPHALYLTAALTKSVVQKGLNWHEFWHNRFATDENRWLILHLRLSFAS